MSIVRVVTTAKCQSFNNITQNNQEIRDSSKQKRKQNKQLTTLPI